MSSYVKTTYRMFVGVSIFYLFTDNVLSSIAVKGPSMSPTLSPNSRSAGLHDRVLLSRLLPQKDLKRGDIVTFWKPHNPEEISIKRVVALEGDTVIPRDRETATEGGYGGYGPRKNYTGGSGMYDGKVVEPDGRVRIVVPHNHIWVEGDNWTASQDSNDFGPISKALLDGKALYIMRNLVWPEEIPKKVPGRGDTKVIEGRSRLPEEYRDLEDMVSATRFLYTRRSIPSTLSRFPYRPPRSQLLYRSILRDLLS
jgi:inner membrane protease subunit 2